VDNFAYPYFQLGVIPGTSLPSIIDLDKAVSHHIALLGITGSGKSYLARKIIEEIKQDTKIICVDFNKEFVRELKPMPPNIIGKIWKPTRQD
jgi:DNA helicase HerA-like ATPase